MNLIQKAYLIIGVLFLSLSSLLIYVGIQASTGIHSQTFLLIGMGVIAFSMSYLYPQFKQKDERTKLIKYKGMFYSYIAMVCYYLSLILLLHFNILHLSAIDVINVLLGLTLITVFLVWVILSKIM